MEFIYLWRLRAAWRKNRILENKKKHVKFCLLSDLKAQSANFVVTNRVYVSWKLYSPLALYHKIATCSDQTRAVLFWRLGDRGRLINIVSTVLNGALWAVENINQNLSVCHRKLCRKSLFTLANAQYRASHRCSLCSAVKHNTSYNSRTVLQREVSYVSDTNF